MDKQIFLIFGLFILALFVEIKAVKVKNVTVPSSYVMKFDSNDTIKLDCDFDIDEDAKGFVLQWKHKKVIIYQWIPRNDKPSVLSQKFKDRVDTNYISGDDRYRQHSSLIITKPLLSDSGPYTCCVQTRAGYDSETAELLIIAPEDSIDLTFESEANNTVDIKCTVTDIYPIPIVKLLFDSEEKDLNVVTDINQKNETFPANITILANIARSDIKDGAEISCQVSIPNSDYMKKQTITYNENSSASLKCSMMSFLFAVSMLLLANN